MTRNSQAFWILITGFHRMILPLLVFFTVESLSLSLISSISQERSADMKDGFLLAHSTAGRLRLLGLEKGRYTLKGVSMRLSMQEIGFPFIVFFAL